MDGKDEKQKETRTPAKEGYGHHGGHVAVSAAMEAKVCSTADRPPALDAVSAHTITTESAFFGESSEFLPAPLPNPTPPREVQGPGAFRVPSSNALQQQARQRPSESLQHPLEIEAGATQEGLLEAQEVHEEDNGSISIAKEFCTEKLEQKKQERKKMKLMGVAIASLALVVILVTTIVAICSTKQSKSNEMITSENITVVTLENSTAQRMTPEENFLSLLPPYTIASITESEVSPQRIAYQWLFGDPLFSNYSDQRLLQRFALATTYYSLGGPEWYRGPNSNWLSYDHHECSWQTKTNYEVFMENLPNARKEVRNQTYWPCEGINGTAPSSDSALPHQQNPEGTFLQLYIENNNLQGTIPEEMYLLTNLKIVNLLKNKIQGTISTRLTQLQDLEILYLDSNDLTGTLPTEIGLLPNIGNVWLFWNQGLGGTIPTEIAQLSTLRELLIDSCNFTGSIPSAIGLMSNLEWFWAWSNPISGSLPTELGRLDKMRQLGLWACSLTGTLPTQLGMMSGMKELALDANPITGTVPSQLGLLSKLTTLHIAELSLSETTIPTELGLLSNLTSVFLHRNQLSGTLPSELGLLTQLSRLWLYNNSLTGTLPLEMVELTTLKELKMENNWLSGSMAALLHENMTTLSLHSNSFTGKVPSELESMMSLKTLSIYDTNVFGTIPASLCESGALTEGIRVDCELVECTCEPCICEDALLNTTVP